MTIIVLFVLNISIIGVSFFLLKSIFKTPYNPIFILILLWFVNLSLAELNPNGYYDLSFNSLKIFYFSIFFLLMGSLSYYIMKKKNMSAQVMVSCQKNKISKVSPFIYFIVFILITVSFLFIVFAMKLMLTYGLSMQSLRNVMFFSNVVEDNPLFSRLIPFMWTVKGLSYFVFFYGLYRFYMGIQDKTILVLSSVPLILLTVGMGGRKGFVDLIYILISFLLILLVQKKKISNNILLKAKKMFKFVILFLFPAIVIMTFMRTGNSDIFSSLYNVYIAYYTGPFFAFDQMLCTGTVNEIVLPHLGASLMGFDTIIVSALLRFILGFDFLSILSQTSYVMHHGVEIGVDKMFNAHYTYLFTSYLDGGVLGIYIFSYVIGFLSLLIFNSFKNNESFLNFSLLLIFYLFALNAGKLSIFESVDFMMALVAVIFYQIIYLKKGKI